MFTHEEIQSLNDLEMSVYNYIIKNKQKVSYMKIRELADESHVSTTTILRMCKKFGCEGYSEFKLKFRQYLRQEKEQKADMDISMLKDYLNRLEMEAAQADIRAALEILRKADNILFIGVGSSGMLAKYGARYFSNVGCFAQCIDDPFTPISQGTSMQTAVVALSVRGETQQVLDMAGRLKERGCHLISITNSANCTLARMSDCNISYYLPDRMVDNTYEITSQVPVICVIEMLALRLYRKKET